MVLPYSDDAHGCAASFQTVVLTALRHFVLMSHYSAGGVNSGTLFEFRRCSRRCISSNGSAHSAASIHSVPTARLRLSSGGARGAASVQMAVTALLQAFRCPQRVFRWCSGGVHGIASHIRCQRHCFIQAVPNSFGTHGAAAAQDVSTALLSVRAEPTALLQFGRCPRHCFS